MKKLVLLIVLIAGTLFISPAADAQTNTRELANVTARSHDKPGYSRYHKKGRKHYKKQHRQHKHGHGHHRHNHHNRH